MELRQLRDALAAQRSGTGALGRFMADPPAGRDARVRTAYPAYNLRIGSERTQARPNRNCRWPGEASPAKARSAVTRAGRQDPERPQQL
jgi:hypothetical protein